MYKLSNLELLNILGAVTDWPKARVRKLATFSHIIDTTVDRNIALFKTSDDRDISI